MPQVDLVTFFPQVFWLSILFLFFYIFILREVLYSINGILKIRLKNIEYNLSNKNLLQNEFLQIYINYSNYCIQLFTKINFLYKNKFNYISTWLISKYSLENILDIFLLQIITKNEVKNQKYILNILINS